MKVPEFEHFADIGALIKEGPQGKQISIRDSKLEQRLSNRDDVRDINVVTAPPVNSLSRSCVPISVLLNALNDSYSLHSLNAPVLSKDAKLI